MTILLVTQLRFARKELIRCLDGVTELDSQKRFEPMNSISWIVGHLADQENRYWVRFAQGIKLLPDLRYLVGYGRPPTTPPLADMWAAWRTITDSADNFLNTLSPEMLPTFLELNRKSAAENIGTMLMRNIYHYWFHVGEAYAIRQLLGHSDLPDFVGSMAEAFYYPEN